MSTTEQTVGDLLNEQEWTGKIFSDGWVDAPETIETIEPATGEVLGTAGVANAASVAAAAKSAARAQREWAATPMTAARRGRAPGSELLERHRAEITTWMVRESGCDPAARPTSRSTRRSASSTRPPSLISHPLGHVLPSLTPGRTSTARRVPIGVVGVITPWNFPIVLAMRSLGPALALGNAVVLKSDPNTPVTGGVMIARLFEEAGLPEGVLHVIGGGAEVGQALVEDPNVRMISFTGSTKTGRLVGEAAGRGLKRIVLELGGNSPLIVLEDADIEAASSAGAWGSFLHQGQICLAVSRHLVHESIAEEYLDGARRARRAPARRQPGARARSRSGRSSTRSRSSACSGSSTRRSARARRRSSAAPRDGLFYPATVLRDVTPRDGGVQGGDLRPGRAGHDVQRPTRRRSSSRTPPSTGSRRPSSPGASRAPPTSPSGSTPGWSTSTTRRSTRSRRRRSAASSASSNGGHFGGVSQLELWTEWQWLTSREKAEPFPF